MSSPSNAKKMPFMPLSAVLWFVFITLLMLYVFYPQSDLMDDVTMSTKANEVTYRYLTILLTHYPHDRLLSLELAEQEVGLGHYKQATKRIDTILAYGQKSPLYWNAKWLHFVMIQQQFFEQKRALQSATDRATILKALQSLAKTPIGRRRLFILADAATKLDAEPLALSLYQQGFARTPHKTAKQFSEAAQLALSLKNYQLSAQYYFAAAQKESTAPTQRQAFLNGLRSLQYGNLMSQAMKALKQYGTRFTFTIKQLKYLTRLALAANQPNVAQHYIVQALQRQAQSV